MAEPNLSWTQCQAMLAAAIAHSPQPFIAWLFSTGMDINFGRCYHPDFDAAFEKQLQVQRAISETGVHEVYKFNANLVKYAQDLSEFHGYSSLITFPARLIEHVLDESKIKEYPYRQILYNYRDKISIEDLRLRFAFIQQFNVYLVKNVLPFIDFRRFKSPSSVSNVLCHDAQSVVFSRIKFDFLQSVLDQTSKPVEVTERPKLLMDRMKMSRIQLANGELDFVTQSNFGHGLSQLPHVDKFMMRPTRPLGAEPFVSFELQLMGQFVEGAAGPYRQYFNDVGKELQSPQSLLLCRTPNAMEAEHKVNTDLLNTNKFVLRPSIPNSYKHKERISETEHLKMFEFLGLLFGCCVRTGVRMPLDIASFVWKAIVHEQLGKRDLMAVDRTFYELLEGIRNMNRTEFVDAFGDDVDLDILYDDRNGRNDNDDEEDDDVDVGDEDGDDQKSEQEQEEKGGDAVRSKSKSKSKSKKKKKMTPLFFTTTLSDKETSVDLKPNGSMLRVTFENRFEFVDLCYEARLAEHDPLIDAIRRGIDKIVPIDALNVLNWRELEMLICGKKEINIKLLRRHTNYSAGLSASNAHIVWFWEVLSEFNEENKSKFIRFAWAQERLPSDDDEFIRTHTRLMIKPPSSNKANQDELLPKADTCFFNLELPKYSTKSILREKLLLAITMSLSMNGDDPDSRVDEDNQFDY